MRYQATRPKATRDFLRNVVPDFISAEVWAPHSQDLNPLDYSVWDGASYKNLCMRGDVNRMQSYIQIKYKYKWGFVERGLQIVQGR